MTVRKVHPFLRIATFVIGIIFAVNFSVYAQEYQEDFDLALSIAEKENKPVLLIFSGSDWCMPCVRLDKEVLQNELFINYANEKVVVVFADFPQRAKQSKELKNQNELLAGKYNPKGMFPHILLLNSHGEQIAEIAYAHQTPKEFIDILNGLLSRQTTKVYSQNLLLMGSAFNLKFITDRGDEGADKLMQLVIDEIRRIEHMISSWDSTSETALINRQAGIAPVAVSEELYRLIERSIAISRLTQGAFDITFNGIYNLYSFDKMSHPLPSEEAIAAGVRHISWQKIELLDSQRVFLPEKGMSIGFGAIGKGFAADMSKKLLLANGVESGVINASGDLTTWGKTLDENDRKVGIANPLNPTEIVVWIPISDRAVATSGDYQKYFMHDGKRYAHIINPKTGYPVTHTRSVTIVSRSAELSDALATAVFVMGTEVGLNLINQLEGTECIIIDHEGKFHYSKGLNYYEEKL